MNDIPRAEREREQAERLEAQLRARLEADRARLLKIEQLQGCAEWAH